MHGAHFSAKAQKQYLKIRNDKPGFVRVIPRIRWLHPTKGWRDGRNGFSKVLSFAAMRKLMEPSS